MSWIQSHSELRDHPKLKKFAKNMGWNIAMAVGALHCFWWWVECYAEDGDLSKFSYDQIGESAEISPGDHSKKFIAALVDAEFVDLEPYLRVHNWLLYSEKYLAEKYRTSNREKLDKILAKNPAVRKIFKKPTPEEVTSYAKSLGFEIDGERFCAYYGSKGWVVGKSPMKDWRAAVVTWKRNNLRESNNGFGKSAQVAVVGDVAKYKDAGFETD
jgi:hypothetical protein